MFRSALVLVVLALGAPTARADRIIGQMETGFELALANASLPAGGLGDVSFKTCEKCDRQSRLLTASTRFFVDGRELAAADFVAAASNIRKAESANPRSLLALYVDPKTLRVNRAVVVRPTR